MDKLLKKLESLRKKLEEINIRAADDTLDEQDERSFKETCAELERVKAAIERQKIIDKENAEAKREADAEAQERTAAQIAAGGPANSQPPEITDVRDREAEKPFRNLGEQLLAIRSASQPNAIIDKRLLHVNEMATRENPEAHRATGASGSAPSEGGFLIQQDVASQIFKIMHDSSTLLQRTRNLPVSANSNGAKIPAVDESSRVTGSRWGGVQAYWLGETEAPTKSKPKFREIELSLNRVGALFYAPDELLADAVLMGAIVEQAFGEEMAFTIEDAIFRGNGHKKPLGVLEGNALVSVAKEASQAADTIQGENVIKMWSRLWARSRPNAVWFINQNCEPELTTLTVTVGTEQKLIYMPADGVRGQQYGTMFGRPVIPIEHASALGDLGDITLLDLSQYATISKGGLKGAQSIHVAFTTFEQAFRWEYRIDGQPIWNNALTPYKGSDTLSPFVALAERA